MSKSSLTNGDKMKWTLILTRILIVSSLITAFHNPLLVQTLSWGVEEGAIYTYALQRKFIDTTDLYWQECAPFLARLEEGDLVNMTVTDLEVIPSTINTADDVPASQCSLTRNGVSIGLDEDVILFVIPVDVWLLSIDYKRYSERLLSTVHSGWDTIYANESDATWIFTDEYFHGQKPIYTGFRELQYDKETGVLRSLWFQETGHYGPNSESIIWDILLVYWTPGMPTILPFMPFPFIGLVAVIAVGTVVVLIPILIKYRGRILARYSTTSGC